ncbi:MAG TPA: hypothetical protein DEG17_14100 [Cyanobacteria bacterium UBA11149]|nr:hypothetical protein [Cyanobacteria bacterium UBA11367]HBE60395.1 hypothetical protein [Cyanobacteria bacterium UBA11366]HBK66330.1 hypothetical protein [Cyanobacteria bacterium UBA11166]HBR73795.1 hypothetical protein [Cyanobacteria bacterium UBA11159]HBS71368.1 hypothetical protein [Cyanobacteria bacterium UBA11153]HBW89970.1 hypothetical protein [Cyanobacteria bacterium UBA11149]
MVFFETQRYAKVSAKVRRGFEIDFLVCSRHFSTQKPVVARNKVLGMKAVYGSAMLPEMILGGVLGVVV